MSLRGSARADVDRRIGRPSACGTRYTRTLQRPSRDSNPWTAAGLAVLLDMTRDGRLHPAIDRVLPREQAGEEFRRIEARSARNAARPAGAAGAPVTTVSVLVVPRIAAATSSAPSP